MEAILAKLGVQADYTREMMLVALMLGRTMSMVWLTPFLAGRVAPTEIKMGFGVGITILMWPLARAQVDFANIPITALPFLLVMLKEVFIGVAIGFVNAHMFWALDMAGRLIDTARGTSMSEVQDPHSKGRVTPTGLLYVNLFLVLFMAMDGHQYFFRAYSESFIVLPVDSYIKFDGAGFEHFIDYIATITGALWTIAVVIAAPIMAATFITDVVFGILNRVAPQLNAYFMSMPVKAWGGVIMLFIALNAVVARLYDYAEWVIVTVEDSIAFLAN